MASGAISGPIMEFDFRPLYLKDSDLLGVTAIPRKIVTDLVRYIEGNEIKPLFHQTFPLKSIRKAQQAFMEKNHVGNLVAITPRI